MSDDKEWLKELKAGDKVFVKRGSDFGGMRVQTVKRITPAGQIRLENDMMFKSDGVHNTGSWSMYNDFLVECNDVNVATVKDIRRYRSRMHKLSNVKWGEDVSAEMVDAVYGMLNEAGVFDE